MRQRYLLTCLMLFFCVITFAQDQIAVKWLSEDQEGITEIYKQNDKYHGKITWLKNPNDEMGTQFMDTENPDISLRKRPLFGLVILKDFHYRSNEWIGGTIYEPQTGKTYRCTMWLSDKGTLNVRGYWGIFYQTQTWTKTN